MNKAMSILLKEYIHLILSEQAPLSYKQLGQEINDAMISLGADVSHVDCEGPGSKRGQYCRVFLNDLKDKDPKELAGLAKKSVQVSFGVPATVKNIGQVHSGKFDTYQVQGLDGSTHNIVFSGGLTTGQRGGGYEYEDEVKKLLGLGGTKADTTLTDVFVKTESGTDIGIEVKGVGAKFGQPTLQYAYATNEFIVPSASRSSKNANLVVHILNATQNPELTTWLNSIKNAWDKIHPEDKMKVLGTQIQPKDWEIMMQSGIRQSGPSVPMSLAQIVVYYKKKKAHYLQIQGKGLYAFNDVLDLGVTSFADAASNLNTFIKPEILKSGGNKVLRASISLDYRTLQKSNMDLENPKDAQKFSTALKKK
jgi:hypothetical protein